MKKINTIRLNLSIVRLFLSLFLLVLGLLSPARAENVLFLTSNSSGYPWQTAVDKEINSIVEQQDEVSLLRENASLLNMQHLEDKELAVKALNAKYKNVSLARIVATGGAVEDLFTTHSEQLLPTIPKFFVNERKISKIESGHSTTVLSERDNLASLVALIKRFFPEQKRIVVVSSLADRESVKKRLALSIPTMSIDLWDQNMSFAEILEKSKQLPEDTLLYFYVMAVDSNEELRVPAQFIEELESVASRPILVSHRTFVGRGALGGSVVDPVDEGQTVGKLIVGELNQKLNPLKTVFDYNKLQKWAIPLSSFVTGDELLNKPEKSFWEDKSNQLLTAFVVVFTLLLLALTALFITLRRNRSNLSSNND